jgi:hypothetical protein
MICPNCSRTLPEHLKVCGYCGARLVAPDRPGSGPEASGGRAETPEPSAAALEPSRTPPPARRRRRRLLLMGAGALVVAAGTTAAVLFIPGGDEPGPTTTGPSPTSQAPATTQTPTAADPFVGQWILADADYPDLPGELLVVEPAGAALRVTTYNHRNSLCSPVAPSTTQWTAQVEDGRLEARAESGQCLGQEATTSYFAFHWDYQARSETLADAIGRVWTPADRRNRLDFVPESPYVGSWTRTSSTTGGRYLWIIDATADGFVVDFYAEVGYWCEEDPSVPAAGRYAAQLNDLGELQLSQTEMTCLGSATRYDWSHETQARFNAGNGTLTEWDAEETLTWERTYELQPDDIYPGA